MSSSSKRRLAPRFFALSINGLPVATESGQKPDEEHEKICISSQMSTTEKCQCQYLYLKCAEVEKLKNLQQEKKDERNEHEINKWKEANFQLHREVSDLEKKENEYIHAMGEQNETNSQLNMNISNLSAEVAKKNEIIDAMKKEQLEMNDCNEVNVQLNKEVSDLKAKQDKIKNENIDAMERQSIELKLKSDENENLSSAIGVLGKTNKELRRQLLEKDLQTVPQQFPDGVVPERRGQENEWKSAKKTAMSPRPSSRPFNDFRSLNDDKQGLMTSNDDV